MSNNIFCNLCFEDKEDSTRTFFCTNCSHVFCSTCLNNYENFCLICKVKCKVLEINEDLPADVKLMFDFTSFDKCFDNAVRAFNFQENQNRLYTQKLKVIVEKYQRVKNNILRLKQMRLDTISNIKLEKTYMEKLKLAYRLVILVEFITSIINLLDNDRSRHITADLFALGSPNTSDFISNGPRIAKKTSTRNESSSSNLFFSTGAASQIRNNSDSSSNTFSGSASFDRTPSSSSSPGSSVFQNSFAGSSGGSESFVVQQSRRLSTDDKVNRQFVPPSKRQHHTQDNQATTYSKVNSQRNLFMKARTDLLESTLRHMQIVSQENFKKIKK